MTKPNKAPKPGTKGFLLHVMPDKDALTEAIIQNGQCEPRFCWHKVGISKEMVKLDPDFDLKSVVIDAGHVKLRYRGWRYVADTPRHVKRSLMLFDARLYDDLYVREYALRFHRATKIVPTSPERTKQISEAQKARKIEGREKPYSRPQVGLRKRVEGFSSIV